MISNLMVLATFDDYDSWRANAFDTDSDRRAKVCDEERTIVSKVDNTSAIILMYGFDLDKMKEFVTNKDMIEREKQYNVSHEIYTFSPIF